jgi:trimeric autotransporter adhesin
LEDNVSGNGNTATGIAALFSNVTGSLNTAFGAGALAAGTGASGNTAVGAQALTYISGSNNTALGYHAGLSVTSGSNNVEIANQGANGDSGTIRIGTQGTQKAAYLAGVYPTLVTGDTVMISKTGQLGVVMSSARFKHDIRDMGGRSSALLKLRPVTFRYNGDRTGALQYGLVAEEVARTYPELVSYGPDGKPMSVRYWMLNAMLLNEVKKLSARAASAERQIAQLRAEQEAQRAVFEKKFDTLERELAQRDNGNKLAAAFQR